MTLRRSGLVLAAATLFAGCAAAPPPALSDEVVDPAAEAEERHVVRTALLYLPNRLFDVLDVARARVRLGPGFGAGVRATELADLTFGAWATVWAGLRGPRGEPRIPWPFGVESLAGAELSIFDVSHEEGTIGPGYGPAEIGLGVHLLLIGAEVGVEPLEVLDFVAGIFVFDPSDDDL